MNPSAILAQLTRGVALLHYISPVIGLESLSRHSDEFPTLQAAFNKVGANVAVTPRMAKAIISFSKELATRNDDHIEFFGGNLLGVQRIRFLDTDRARWFDDILEIDEDYLRESVHAVPYIDKDWLVGSDVFNLSCVWLVHKLMTATTPIDKLYYQAAVETLVILQFRFITSIYSQYFRRPVDRAAAEATYAAFTLKFNIKRMGSWGDVLRQRADSFVNEESTHINTLHTFQPDDKIVYVVTDLQTRTRQTIKDQYKVLDKVRSGNLRIQTTQATITLDGDKIIKDQVNAYNSARYYLLDVAGNEASFVKRDLIGVILDLMKTVSEGAFNDLLRVIANMPEGKRRREVEWMLETTLMHAFDYIAKNRVRFTDVGIILVKMRALYMSSKSSDPTLLELRSRIERFVHTYSHLRSPAALASARTTLMLYFLLRALSSSQYK